MGIQVKRIFNNKKCVRIFMSSKPRASENMKKLIEENSDNSEVNLIDDTHAKIILAKPNFVYLSSQNVEESDWFQGAIIIRDKLIYDYYFDMIDKLKNGSPVYNIKIEENTDDPKNQRTLRSYDSYQSKEPNKYVDNVEIKFSKMLNWNQKFNGYHNRKIIITSHILPKLE